MTSVHTRNSSIAEWQAKVRAQPMLYCVYVRCDGEESIDAIYDSVEAALLHVRWHNGRPGNKNYYYGKAGYSSERLMTLELARERFDPLTETERSPT